VALVVEPESRIDAGGNDGRLLSSDGVLSQLPVDARQPLIQKADPDSELVIAVALGRAGIRP